eukprot:3792316-Amphidinium_carterae.2
MQWFLSCPQQSRANGGYHKSGAENNLIPRAPRSLESVAECSVCYTDWYQETSPSTNLAWPSWRIVGILLCVSSKCVFVEAMALESLRDSMRKLWSVKISQSSRKYLRTFVFKRASVLAKWIAAIRCGVCVQRGHSKDEVKSLHPTLCDMQPSSNKDMAS